MDRGALLPAQGPAQVPRWVVVRTTEAGGQVLVSDQRKITPETEGRSHSTASPSARQRIMQRLIRYPAMSPHLSFKSALQKPFRKLGAFQSMSHLVSLHGPAVKPFLWIHWRLWFTFSLMQAPCCVCCISGLSLSLLRGLCPIRSSQKNVPHSP